MPKVKVEKEFDKNMSFLPELLTSDSSSFLTKNLQLCKHYVLLHIMFFFICSSLVVSPYWGIYFNSLRLRNFMVLAFLLLFLLQCIILHSPNIFSARSGTVRPRRLASIKDYRFLRLAAKIFTANIFSFVFCKQATCVIISLRGLWFYSGDRLLTAHEPTKSILKYCLVIIT
jgi:hypothetical protein